jgi:hypothetical protein
MVVFDNAKNLIGEFKKSYTKAKIDQIAERALNYWTDGVPKPDIALISPGENSARLSLLKNFTKWVDF